MTTAQLMHFVVTAVYYTWLPTGFKIDCYTNNPCHLYLRWTNVEPQHHVNPKIVRGAVAGTWIDQCFVVFYDIEQTQAGDTIRHTFYVFPWPNCQKRWFYFYGYVGGQLSPSCSPIFVNDHCVDHYPPNPEGTLIIFEPWTSGEAHSDWTFGWEGSPQFDPSTFIDPPTSLSAHGGIGQWNRGWTAQTGIPCIPEIKLINNVYFKFNASESHVDYFRAQALPGPALYPPWNCYELKFYPNFAVFNYIVNGAPWPIANYQFVPSLPLNTWYQYRFILWDLPNHTNPTSIGYEFDLWENEAWAPKMSGVSLVSHWPHSLTNMYIFKLLCQSPWNNIGVKVDQTQIFTPPW
jgi:hypothetical protein